MQVSTGRILTEVEVNELDDKTLPADYYPIPVDTKVDTIRKLQNATPGDRKAALKSMQRKHKLYNANPGDTQKFINKTEKRRKKDKIAKASRRQQRKK